MDWEDCVVDVHSVKISKSVLETMFKNCGSVRSIIHWKGQGEKPHVFFEYKSPAAADSARAVGLDRHDLQVIKISNNEMLKKKFRELAHGPIRERDPRGRPTRPSSRSIYTHLDREYSHGSVAETDHRLPSKLNDLNVYASDHYGSEKYHKPATRHDDRDVECRPSTSASAASPFPASREHHSKRHRGSSRLADDGEGFSESRNNHLSKSPDVLVRSIGQETRINHIDKSLTVLKIPHAGEVIKFDLDTQLEENPAGIIRILSAVKADQKLWMMTAAYYKGKNNLLSAKKVLEAGIDTTIRLGEETDTKPFWHLLGQINASILTLSSPTTSTNILSPLTSTFSSVANSSPEMVEHIFNETGSEKNLSPAAFSHEAATPGIIADAPGNDDTRGPGGRVLKESSLPQMPGCTLNLQTHSMGSKAQHNHSSTFPISPSGLINTSTQLYGLQSEIQALREKQETMLEDLSQARIAKRRAEDEVKEERSIRRKVEKNLRLVEDALTRSKRMEDAALDQVKREVESRRRAEGLLAELKVLKDQDQPATTDVGRSLFTSSPSDATVLLQLASMIRGIPSHEVMETTSNSSSTWFSGEHSMAGNSK